MPRLKLTIQEMNSLAESMGGKCLSKEYVSTKTKLRWRCANEHEFEATPNAVKNQGTWCPICGFQRMRKSLIRDEKHIMKVISEESPKFPRKDPSHDKRRKLTEEQVEEIKHLRKMGNYLVAIAKKFGIAHQTVMYHTDAERKKRINRLIYLSRKERLSRDPEYKQKMRQASAKYIDERLKEPMFRRYYNKVRNIRSKYNYYRKGGRIPND